MEGIRLKNKISKYTAMIFMAALLLLIVSSLILYSKNAKEPGTTSINSSQNEEVSLKIKDLEDRNSALSKENNDLKSSSLIESYNKLIKADDLARSGNLNDAKVIFDTLKESDYNDYGKDKYISIKDKIYPTASITTTPPPVETPAVEEKPKTPDVPKVSATTAWKYYDDGIKACEARNYKQATTLLSKAIANGKGQSFMDDAEYFIAVAYNAIGDKSSAKKYLNMLFNSYPNSNYISRARSLYKTL